MSEQAPDSGVRRESGKYIGDWHFANGACPCGQRHSIDQAVELNGVKGKVK
jgi:hypothetical protein